MIFNLCIPHPPQPAPPAASLPAFTYTGRYELIDEGEANGARNWNLRFLTGGTLKFTDFGGAERFDVFLCGGGGAGARPVKQSSGYWGGQGGGGGRTLTRRGLALSAGENYYISIGAGGAGTGTVVNRAADGEATSAFGCTAEGGQGGGASVNNASVFGAGGCGGGNGAMNDGVNQASCNGRGGDGGFGDILGGEYMGNGGLSSSSVTAYAQGQDTSTREYGEASGRMYGCGGSGAGGWRSSSSYGYSGAVYAPPGDPVVYAGTGAGHNEPGSGHHEAASAGPNTGGGGGGANYGGADATASWGKTAGSGGSGIVCLRNARG